MKIKIKRLHPKAKLPTRATDGSAAYDLYACCPEAQATKGTIPIGVAVAIPKGFVGLVCPRSGLSVKERLDIPNSPGIIDSDYRGELRVCLRTEDRRDCARAHGDRVAQLLIVPCVDVEWHEVDELDGTERGSNGFGSTGV